MDCRLQVSCSGLWEFVVPYWNRVVLKKFFLGFLFHLWNLHRISNIFKKKAIVIGNVFSKLATVQGFVKPLTIQRSHGLLIRSILIRIVRICRSLFKSSYLKNKKHFLGFLFHLWNLHQILNIFEKKKIVMAYVFPKITTL